ncbi:MAG: hypothetical protein AB7H96_05410 [Vicinamibacterales bacterium]
MIKRVCGVMAACSLWAASAMAQGSGMDGSQLGFFMGRWTVEGLARPGGAGGFGAASGTETCAWFSGGPSMVCRQTIKDSDSETDSIFILSYDPVRKQYTAHGTDNTGVVTTLTGTLASGVWRLAGERRGADGKATPTRYTFREAPGGGRAMDIEVGGAKGAWTKTVGVTLRRAR